MVYLVVQLRCLLRLPGVTWLFLMLKYDLVPIQVTAVRQLMVALASQQVLCHLQTSRCYWLPRHRHNTLRQIRTLIWFRYKHVLVRHLVCLVKML